MMLLLSVLQDVIPLLGIAWTVMNGTVTSVDGLFLSLILLALSGIMSLNVVIELRKMLKKPPAPAAQKPS